jgi:hypothetical protein
MADSAPAPKAKARRTRWDGTTQAERSAYAAELAKASARARRAERIAKLIEQFPPLTDEQRARLIVLLLKPTRSGVSDGQR